MASTITAGNATGGLGISSDNTGALDIKTGSGAGTTAISIDASQNVTIPGTLTIAGQPAGGDYVMRTYTSPSPWTKPVGLKAIKVTVLGAGGAGGNANRNPSPSVAGLGGGGGSGGFSIGYFDAPAIPGPVTVTAGSGTSSFGPLVSCTAGSAGGAGISTNGAGGSGGTATSGLISLSGFSGAPGNTAPGETTVAGARSGANSWFLGIGAIGPTGEANGTTGTGYGAGGSGAWAGTVGVARTGGTGQPGIVIVEEFY